MFKRMLTFVFAAILAGAWLLPGDAATAPQGHMKEKHQMKMMHGSMEGEQHHQGNHACCRMDGEPGEGHGFFLGMKDELGLTDEQVAKLRTLQSETQKQVIKTKADLEIARIELHDLLGGDNVDVKSVDAKVEKIGELQTKIHKARLHAMLDAQKILTAEQRQKYKQMQGRKKHPMHESGREMQ